MPTALQTFFQKPTTLVGIATALMFQLIFGVVWMTGYADVNDNLGKLSVAVVNEDPDVGVRVAESLPSRLPFQVASLSSFSEALERLKQRDVYLVLHIPRDFSQRLSDPDGQAALSFTLNESNPALVRSVMQGVAAQVTASVNREAVALGAERLLQQLNAPATAKPAVINLAERIKAEVTSIHPVNSFARQMIPLMTVLASYVGAMIMGLNLQQSAQALASQVGKWQLFAARGIIQLVTSAVVALVGASLAAGLGGVPAQGFLVLWAVMALTMLTFLFVAQVFLLLLGPAGMVLNILLLSVQLVSCGAMVPRELLSPFYSGISSFLPATYAVEGLMNVVMGGPAPGESMLALLWILLCAAAAGAMIVTFRRGKPQQLVPQPEAS